MLSKNKEECNVKAEEAPINYFPPNIFRLKQNNSCCKSELTWVGLGESVSVQKIPAREETDTQICKPAKRCGKPNLQKYIY